VKKIPAALLFFLFSSLCFSQPTLDTLGYCIRQKPALFAKIDTRNSFIGNSRAQVIGLKAGLNFNKRLFLGAGYNQLYKTNSTFAKQIYYVNENNLRDSVTGNLKMYYISIHAEYIFHRAGKWQISMPLQFGIGQSYYRYKLGGQSKKREENTHLIYEPGVSIEYKIIRWVGLGADIGYRFLITDDRQLSNKFTSPTYAFKFLIYYAELYRSIIRKEK
jgi:hypothetical protein